MRYASYNASDRQVKCPSVVFLRALVLESWRKQRSLICPTCFFALNFQVCEADDQRPERLRLKNAGSV